MTDTESKLASIERLPEGTYRDTKGIGWHGTVVSPTELEWLIAEVRRLQAERASLAKAVRVWAETQSPWRRYIPQPRSDIVEAEKTLNALIEGDA